MLHRPIALAAAALLVATAAGCGPAFRVRSPDILDKGDVEFGGALGAAARAPSGQGDKADFGGAEIQAWLRGSPTKHSEIAGKFWTSTFSSFGGAMEVRIQPIRRPVALSIDLGFQGAYCCAITSGGSRNLGAGLGWDAGFTFGGRIGGDDGIAAPYIAPHFQMTWTIESVVNQSARQGRIDVLFIPIGSDFRLGKSPVHLRPEFLTSVHFQKDIAPQARIGGALAVAVVGPGFGKVAKAQKAKKQGEQGAQPES